MSVILNSVMTTQSVPTLLEAFSAPVKMAIVEMECTIALVKWLILFVICIHFTFI